MKASSFTKSPIHLCLCKLGHKVLALLSSDIYILSGDKIAVVYPLSHSETSELLASNGNDIETKRNNSSMIGVFSVSKRNELQTGGGGGWHKTFPRHRNCRKKSLMVKDHY